MIEADLKTFLLDSDSIRDVVGNRVFAGKAPKSSRGAVLIVRNTSPDHFYTLTNEANALRAMVQIDCYDETPTKADALGELVRNRLSGYRGTAGGATIQGATIARDNAFRESPENSSDKWIHRRSFDFSIFYAQTVPTHE